MQKKESKVIPINSLVAGRILMQIAIRVIKEEQEAKGKAQASK